MQTFRVYQSLWAMERRRPDGLEWSLEQKLAMIRDAGFDGAGVRFADYQYARTVTTFLREHGMSWQAQCYPRTVDELKPIIEHVQALGADHINLQADVRPATLAECIPYVEGWTRLADDAGIALHIETHRDRMTTDLLFTLQLLERFPTLRLTADLSHYVVGREFAWPISAENHALIKRILDQSWGFHGRVASREQIQLQLGFAQHRQWVDLFMRWWREGFTDWRKRAPDGAVLTFLCELGPPEYAMTGADGYELSDRWHEAQELMRMVRALWKSTELDLDAAFTKEQAPSNI
ncbi:sugar phosphate isomerase/epimerase [Herbaspirillum sp. YR522]|uniref:sugar phosphate isomerase/epimerase family protein n=1 Tax=Herbaspirillum sp. YR522 TaxID=1144342 RepID=UPI00026F4AA1|nr:TIM barrel protein [Herbaspirillum sp. YR522]EJN07382.1 xylose isomerase-like enzyme [Herbaspirillum sp. YR522]